MPFIAQDPDTGTAVQTQDIGEKYNHREDFECPYCGDELRFRRASKDPDGSTKRRAHFWHTEGIGESGETGGCSKGGESAEHEKWKEVIGELLADKYDVDDFHVEYRIHDRVADVAIQLDDGDRRGVVAEYQDKNAGKDYLDVTKQYLKFGYSVYWIFNTNKTYDLLFDAKNALSPFCDNLYLGQQNINEDEIVQFGTELWFDNFNWVVQYPDDFNPQSLVETDNGCLYDYGSYNIGRVRHVYEFVPEKSYFTGYLRNGIDSWDDVMELYFSDESGGGELVAFERRIKSGQATLNGPIDLHTSIDGEIPEKI